LFSFSVVVQKIPFKAKIVTNGAVKITLMFEIYGRLFKTKSVELNSPMNTILFPLGVANLPQKEVEASENVYAHMLRMIRKYFDPRTFPLDKDRPYPLVIYPLLGNEWHNTTITKPEKRWHLAFKEQLLRAVNWLNAAEVSHNDLLPRNVMWRVTNDNRLELKLIDFEYSCFFGDYIPHYFNTACEGDSRYPFNKLAVGRKEYNDFFYKNILDFLVSSEGRFSTFMDFREPPQSPSRPASTRWMTTINEVGHMFRFVNIKNESKETKKDKTNEKKSKANEKKDEAKEKKDEADEKKDK
jgi:hypothetical protein